MTTLIWDELTAERGDPRQPWTPSPVPAFDLSAVVFTVRGEDFTLADVDDGQPVAREVAPATAGRAPRRHSRRGKK